MVALRAPRLTGIWLAPDRLYRPTSLEGSPMKKPPGVFSLLTAALTGFGAHLVNLCTTARTRLLALQSPKARSGKR
jgi:hypothetical protein